MKTATPKQTTADEVAPAHESSGLHGRRKGKPLSPLRQGLMQDLLPRLKLSLDGPAPAGAAALFAHPVTAIRMEIGFGGGEHLIAEAEAAPGVGFIGVEPFVNGLSKAVKAIGERGLSNIRLHDGDAARVLDWLPDGSLDLIELLYPDPWPKKRHWKRRFVSPENLDRIVRALKPGGLFRFASDIGSYVDWTRAHVAARPDLVPTGDDPRRPYPGWPGTRYEAKALREGRTPAYLSFLKI